MRKIEAAGGELRWAQNSVQAAEREVARVANERDQGERYIADAKKTIALCVERIHQVDEAVDSSRRLLSAEAVAS